MDAFKIFLELWYIYSPITYFFNKKDADYIKICIINLNIDIYKIREKLTILIA